MRTPGHDIELVHGLLHSEQVIRAAADVTLARYCAGAGPDGLNTYNVLDVTLAAGVTGAGDRPAAQRAHHQRLRDLRRDLDRGGHPGGPIHARSAGSGCRRAVISRGQDQLRAQQRVFAQTGGLHAAGLLSHQRRAPLRPGGRRTAQRGRQGDRLGPAGANRLPLSETVLCVSGRASFELTQKAVLAGFPVLAAVSAPSSLAVELAEPAGLTLVGFVRGDTMNVYTHPGTDLLSPCVGPRRVGRSVATTEHPRSVPSRSGRGLGTGPGIDLGDAT